jgi:hypothetical protein
MTAPAKPRKSCLSQDPSFGRSCLRLSERFSLSLCSDPKAGRAEAEPEHHRDGAGRSALPLKDGCKAKPRSIELVELEKVVQVGIRTFHLLILIFCSDSVNGSVFHLFVDRLLVLP